MGFTRSPARVHDVHSVRFAVGNRQIGVADASEKSAILLLKAILVAFFF